jgi:hypothetical protein
VIARVSVPSRDPRPTALFFAALIDGLAYEFPVVPGAWIAVARDRFGLAVEVYPDTMAHHPGWGEPDPAVRPDSPRTMPWEDQIHADGQQVRPSAFHVALSTGLAADDVVRLARQHGWRALKCERGGVFGVVEVWLDETLLVEVPTEVEVRRYRQFMQPDVCGAMFGQGHAPE